MKKLIAAIIVALPLSVTSALASDATPQQNKMAACSKQNKGLKGDEYKMAQKECLSKDAAPVKEATAPAKAAAVAAEKPATNQKEKMAACSKENKGLKGDAYKKAQKDCLSK